MKKCIITVGCSASGKSTFANNFLENTGDVWMKIERDNIRECLLMDKYPNINFTETNIWQYWKFKWEDEVTEIFDGQILDCYNHDESIIISDTNLNQDRRGVLISKMQELGYDVEVKIFGEDLTLEELWKRDLYRKNSVGHQVIAKQYQQFRKEFPRYKLKDTFSPQSAIIFDVDGTLANMNGNRSPYEWDKVNLDVPNWVVINSLVAQYFDGYKIIIMSGRDSVCRKLTEDWLKYYLGIASDNISHHATHIPIEFDLYMRPENDQRSDVLVKHDLFMEHVDGKYQVKAVFDDRPKVVRLWQDMGFDVIQCGNQNIEF